MSLALFHEWQDSQQAVDQVISGCFTLGTASSQFVTKCGNSIVLYTCVEEGSNGAHLRIVSRVNFQAKVCAIGTLKSSAGTSTSDSVVVLLRYGVLSVLQFDESLNEFRTTSSVCLLSSGSSDIGNLFISPLLRIRGMHALVQLDATSLTIVHLTEGTSVTVPVGLSERVSLASVDDALILDVTDSEVVLGVLGKVHSHAWVGRTSTIGTEAGVVRMISVDLLRKSVSVIWSFENLPTDCSRMVSTRGGLLAVGSGSVSFCAEFSSAITWPCGQNMSRAALVALRPDLVLSCLQDGSFMAVHVLADNKVVLGDEYVLETKFPSKPACCAVIDNFLFVGSRDGDSQLFYVRDKQIAREDVPLFSAGASLGELCADLIAEYQAEFLASRQINSVELGLCDEIFGIGKINAVVDGICTSSSGRVCEVSESGWPVAVAFETKLKSAISGVGGGRKIGQKSFTVLLGTEAEQGLVILVDTTVGFKEAGRWLVAEKQILETFWRDDDRLVVVTKHALVFIDAVGSGEVHEIPYSNDVISACLDSDAVLVVVQVNPSELALSRIESLHNPAPIRLVLPASDSEIHSVSLGPSWVTVSDTNGSLVIFETRSGSLCFQSKYASLCRAVLVSDTEESSGDTERLMTSLSITDVTKRPLETDPSIPGFARQIRISSAELLELGSSRLLVVRIEGRPVMVYAEFAPWQFKLLVIDCPSICDGSRRAALRADAVAGCVSVLVPVSRVDSLLVCVDSYRNRIIGHRARIAGESVACLESSDLFPHGGLVVVDQGQILRLYKTDAWSLDTSVLPMRNVLEEPAQGRVMMLPRVGPMGVAIVVASFDNEPEQDPPAELDEDRPPGNEPPRQVVHVMTGEFLSAIFPLQPNEMVTDMAWAGSVVGLGADILAVGTTYLLGEEAPVQGRLLLIRAEGNSVSASSEPVGCKLIYEMPKKSAVTAVKDWRGSLAVGLDHRLMMYQWDVSAGRLRGCGMYDMALQITSLAFTKNYIAAGDVLRGVHFLRWKEDPVIDFATGLTTSMAASVQFLAKSHPLQPICVTALEVITLDNSAGIATIDRHSNLNLEIFAPMNYGAHLRPSLPFQLPAPAVNIHKAPGAAVIGTASGSICTLTPVSEADHHLAASLTGLMVALLPHVGGANPRLKHVALGRSPAPGAVHAIESVDLLLYFLYLSTPLQAEIASRMKQPIDSLVRSVARWLTPQ